MRPVEYIYLLMGLGIAIQGVVRHTLTLEELGAAMFFIGLVPVTRADAASRKAKGIQKASPMEVLRTLIANWLSGGSGDPK